MAEELLPMRNIRLKLAYDGTDFHGWQRQPNASTIQTLLEEAIQRLTGAPVSVTGSGRTDAGVHAAGQAAHFHTTSTIPCVNFAKALNNLLPPTVRIIALNDVEPDFHARYSARRKTYWYRILTAPVCSPLKWRFVHHYPYPLNREAMAKAAASLLGEHDFASFTTAEALRDEDFKSAVRTIVKSRFLWSGKSSTLVYQITGTGFLRYMVRNIVGTLMEVGRGRLTTSDIPRILKARDRRLAGPTASPQGLCLMNVEYDD